MSTPADTEDAPLSGPQAWAALTLSIDGISKQLAASEARTAAARSYRSSIRGPIVRAGVVPAAGPLVLDLGVPAMGRRWTVRNLSVSDAAAVGTALTGKADIYLGSPLAYGPTGWRDHLDALPAVKLYDADQVDVIPSDHLVVVVTGATAGQVVMARADVLDYPNALGRPVQPL